MDPRSRSRSLTDSLCVCVRAMSAPILARKALGGKSARCVAPVTITHSAITSTAHASACRATAAIKYVNNLSLISLVTLYFSP